MLTFKTLGRVSQNIICNSISSLVDECWCWYRVNANLVSIMNVDGERGGQSQSRTFVNWNTSSPQLRLSLRRFAINFLLLCNQKTLHGSYSILSGAVIVRDTIANFYEPKLDFNKRLLIWLLGLKATKHDSLLFIGWIMRGPSGVQWEAVKIVISFVSNPHYIGLPSFSGSGARNCFFDCFTAYIGAGMLQSGVEHRNKWFD